MLITMFLRYHLERMNLRVVVKEAIVKILQQKGRERERRSQNFEFDAISKHLWAPSNPSTHALLTNPIIYSIYPLLMPEVKSMV